MKSKLILASASPRRLDLLKQAGIAPTDVIPADIDETIIKGELPRNHALRLACEKAETIAKSKEFTDTYILAADTVVACGRRILPKAEERKQAQACLSQLSGRRHKVYGGLCIIGPHGQVSSRVCTTEVQFKKLSDQELKIYLDSGEWEGKAGGYAIQGMADIFVKSIKGSYSNVVGLSLYDTMKILNGLGFDPGQ